MVSAYLFGFVRLRLSLFPVRAESGTDGQTSRMRILCTYAVRATRQPGNSAFANISWLSNKKMKIGGAGGTSAINSYSWGATALHDCMCSHKPMCRRLAIAYPRYKSNMSTPNKTTGPPGASGVTAAASASVALVSPDDGNMHKQHHFVSVPNNVHIDLAGQTSLHRAIYSIARQAASSTSVPSSSSSSSPIEMIDQILSTSDGYHATNVRCRRGGWSPLHLCCRLVVIPDEIICALAERNPMAIAIQDDDGETCIHLACRYGLSDAVINRLIALSPQSAFVARDEENGEIPLHAAIHHGASPDVLKILVDVNPNAVRECNDNGQSALHLGCEYERHDFIKVAVESMAATRPTSRACMRQISQIDELGSTPISILWSTFVESFGGSVEDPHCTWCDAANAEEGLEQAATWASLVTVMTTAFTRGALKDEDEDGHTLLRSAIGLGVDSVPASLFQYIVSRFPFAVRKANCKGHLPLHEAIFASSKSTGRRHIDNEADMCFIDHRDDDDQDCVCADNNDNESRTGKPAYENEGKQLQYESTCSDDGSLSSPSSFDEIQDVLEAMRSSPIHILLDAYPQAASIPSGDGRLALHLAVEAGISWDEGLSKIFASAPCSLRIRDPKTGLLPFLLAATSGAGKPPSTHSRMEGDRAKDVDSVNTIFQLLRLGPDLITSCDQRNESTKRRNLESIDAMSPYKKTRIC